VGRDVLHRPAGQGGKDGEKGGCGTKDNQTSYRWEIQKAQARGKENDGKRERPQTVLLQKQGQKKKVWDPGGASVERSPLVTRGAL